MASERRRSILVIDDNADTRRFLEVLLAREFEVASAENAVLGIEMARATQPDAILLDAVLPILSGYDACSLLKKDEKTRHIPVIFISARGAPTDVARGLSSGADDYIPKPFDHNELLARLRARARASAELGSARELVVGDLRIDAATRGVTFGGRAARLTLTEMDILRILAVNAGTPVPRQDILQKVWKDDSSRSDARTIDVHIRALRKKIPPLARHIVSVYGVGYKYEK